LIYTFAGCGLFTTALAYSFDARRVWTALVASRTGADSAWQDPGLWNNLAAFGMFGASYLLIEAWTPSRRRKIWQAIVGLAACLPFVMGGTRHLVLFVLLPVLVAGITRLRRMTIGRILALFLAGVVVFAILQLQYAVRAQGWDSLSKKVHTKDLFTNSTAQFSALLFALHLVPAEHGFFYELAEPYFLIHWIPRAVWPDKPVMATWTFYNNAYTLGGRFNVTPSVIGQFYMNWGTPGVAVIGLWLGMLTRFADLLIRSIDVDKQRALVVLAGMLHAFVIVSFRYYHPLYFTYWAFGLVATILITDRPHSWRAIAKSLRVS
jgi:oligosaccharide repeat unit polymerase